MIVLIIQYLHKRRCGYEPTHRHIKDADIRSITTFAIETQSINPFRERTDRDTINQIS